MRQLERWFKGGVDADYAMEVTAMGRRERQTRGGGVQFEYYNKRKADHFCDCEQMQIICASAAGLLSAPDESDPSGTGARKPNDEQQHDQDESEYR